MGSLHLLRPPGRTVRRWMRGAARQPGFPLRNGITNISCTDGTVSHIGCCLSDPQRVGSRSSRRQQLKWSNPSQPSRFFPYLGRRLLRCRVLRRRLRPERLRLWPKEIGLMFGRQSGSAQSRSGPPSRLVVSRTQPDNQVFKRRGW
jgi:hypothetical protein